MLPYTHDSYRSALIGYSLQYQCASGEVVLAGVSDLPAIEQIVRRLSCPMMLSMSVVYSVARKMVHRSRCDFRGMCFSIGVGEFRFGNVNACGGRRL